MKTYLVTGGAGFIGSHLTEKLLNEGNKVIAIDNFNDFYNPKIKENNIKDYINNPNYKLEKVDIRNKKEIDRIFKENKIDNIMHLAAMAGVRPSIENPILYQEVNCLGSQNILEAMKENNIKNIVFASSSSVYGNTKTVPFKETDIVDYAVSPYAATKKANEVMCHVYHKLFGFNVIMLRFFTVYGERQRPDLAINKFTRYIMEGKPIPVFGDGTTSRDYTYIKDIIDGVYKSLKYVENNENVYEILNIGESEPITLNQMIETIEQVLGKKAIINRLPMQPGDVDRTYADITKAKNLISYEPKTSFKQGIGNFVRWYEKNKNLYE